jgi:predicted alpha-1,2-mannosidase
MSGTRSHRLNVLCALSALFGVTITAVAADKLQAPRPAVGPGPLGKEVNPFIGTGGVFYLCGNNFPGATVPFGAVRLSPDTVSILGKRATNSSGYYYSDARLLGFSHTRLAGTGATDGGNFLVIPTTADKVSAHRRGLNIEFSHQFETAVPGYYGLRLPKLGVTAELTATKHVGVHRYTFSGNIDPRILLQVTSVLGKGEVKSGDVRILPDSNEIEGSVETFGTFSKRYGGLKSYFVARVNRPVNDFSIWTDDAEQQGSATAQGDNICVALGFAKDQAPQVVELKLAVSYVSIANARVNLQQEAADKDFQQVLADAVGQWEQVLGRIQITGGSDKERTIFRTALYHSFQMPTVFSDCNGEYFGFDRAVHQAADFQYYTDLSLWDTFRTVHPLYNLIARREQRDMLVSLVTMASQGGYLPRWPSGAGYTNSMFGTPADLVITESYLKGIHDFDAASAYQFMRQAALAPVPSGSRFSGRVGIEHYLKYQYCPGDLMKKSVASTIEYCYADHSIARLAEALGHHDDAKLFREHAGFYRNLWNSETQFFQPRHSTGSFLDFRPDMLTYLDATGEFTHGYVEGSAWQWRWGYPSDADGVVSLFKSKQFFVEELSKFFDESPSGVGLNPNAYYWHGNQPDLFAAYLFNHVGRPDLTQKWVRWILATKYGDRENGLDGNDDGGTLSAWYVFSSLGLFPVAGTDRYEIGSPLWQNAEIAIGEKTLRIVTENAAGDATGAQKVWLNEKLLDRTWIRHEEIANGGTLRFERTPPINGP